MGEFLTPQVMVIALAVLAALAVGGVAYALFFNRVRGKNSAELRVAAVAERSGSAAVVVRAADAVARRRKSVQESLKEADIREMISGSIDVIVHVSRLRDGSRRITHITEVIGMEGEVIITQDLLRYEVTGEDSNGRIIGRHVGTGIGRPAFWDSARYFNLENRLAMALDKASPENAAA